MKVIDIGVSLKRQSINCRGSAQKSIPATFPDRKTLERDSLIRSVGFSGSNENDFVSRSRQGLAFFMENAYVERRMCRCQDTNFSRHARSFLEMEYLSGVNWRENAGAGKVRAGIGPDCLIALWTFRYALTRAWTIRHTLNPTPIHNHSTRLSSRSPLNRLTITQYKTSRPKTRK